MSELLTPTLVRPLAILSLLAEDAARNPSSRPFRGESVLTATVSRVREVLDAESIVIIAWDDQIAAARSAIGENAGIRSVGPRRVIPSLAISTAAARWMDGWRGGLMGTTTFDRGFDAASILAELESRECDAAILIDASAAMISPSTLRCLIQHLQDRTTIDFAFTPGTPGSGAMILRRDAIIELHRNGRQPGQLLGYHPDRPQHDPIAKEVAVPVSTRIARSLSRITIDSDRQVARMSLLQASEVEEYAGALDPLRRTLDRMPRDVVVELITDRQTRPAFSPIAHHPPTREPMTLERATRLFAQLGAVDDIRLTFAGLGDPLLHPQFDQILAAARSAGIRAIHVETDLLPTNPRAIAALVANQVDVVSIHLPAVHRDTYTELMGVDRIQDVLDQFKQLVTARSRSASGLPIVVPIFTKCEANLGEMEQWYDQWIRALGAAVIVGPSDFGGQIPYIGVSDMSPPVRGACRRLQSRLTILSDGRIVSCEEDVFAQQVVGEIDQATLEHAWTQGMDSLRQSACGPVCTQCRMWDRP